MNEKGGAYAAQYMPLLENISIGSFKMGSLVKALAGFGVSLGLFAVVIAIIGIAGAITRMRLLLIIVSIFVITGDNVYQIDSHLTLKKCHKRFFAICIFTSRY